MRGAKLPQGDDEISKAIRTLAERIDELDSRTTGMVPMGPRRKTEAEEAAESKGRGDKIGAILSKMNLEYVCSNPTCKSRYGYQVQGHCPICKSSDGKGWSVYRDAPTPVDRSTQELVSGKPVPKDGSHKELKGNGQQVDYIVLSEEERRKGFVRPVRKSYRHVGLAAPRFPLRDLTPEEHERYKECGYGKYEEYPADSEGCCGMFWTKKNLDKIGKGCGVVTTMSAALAETYARDPHFYSGTFCFGCGSHFPVGENGEFVWEGTNERVGT
jgi:hypothetical protein